MEELNSPVVDLSVGLMHVVALTKDGKLYGWGKNDQNQLGKGTNILLIWFVQTFFFLVFIFKGVLFKVPYFPHWDGENIKSVEEEYQVVKRAREYHGWEEEYNVEKRERGSNIISCILY